LIFGGLYPQLAMEFDASEVCDWLVCVGAGYVLLKYRVPGIATDRSGLWKKARSKTPIVAYLRWSHAIRNEKRAEDSESHNAKETVKAGLQL
jgi:hypothetical protein